MVILYFNNDSQRTIISLTLGAFRTSIKSTTCKIFNKVSVGERLKYTLPFTFAWGEVRELVMSTDYSDFHRNLLLFQHLQAKVENPGVALFLSEEWRWMVSLLGAGAQKQGGSGRRATVAGKKTNNYQIKNIHTITRIDLLKRCLLTAAAKAEENDE